MSKEPDGLPPASLPSAPGSPEQAPRKEEKDKDGAGKKGKSKDSKRSILTIYRTSSRNHISLSAIADRKANFLLSVCTVLSSVTFTFLLRHVQTRPVYALPGLLLIAVCTVTIVFAILSTLPAAGKGVFTREQVQAKKANLLFFGNFYRMSAHEYDWAINELLHDPEYMKEAISYDMYHLGVTVARKFRYLRIAYFIFMIGIVISIAAGYVAFVYRISLFTDFFMKT